MEERGEDTTLLSDALQLQSKDTDVRNMISTVNAFSAKLGFFIQQLNAKRFQHFPSVSKVLETHAGAAGALNTEKYCDLLIKLGQEFADRFRDFEKLEPCVTFIANSIVDVDINEISGQMAELFCVDPVEMEMELLNLQNDDQLKSQQHSQHFLSMVEPENCRNLCQAALKIAALFGSTAFSDMNVMKSKFRTKLTDEHLKDSIRVNLSGYIPSYSSLVGSMQCQVSH